MTETDSRVTSLTLMMTRRTWSTGAGLVCHKLVRTFQDTSMRMTAITCVDITGVERYDYYDDGNKQS